MDATVDGVVPVALPGAATATELDLTGTTASADADLANASRSRDVLRAGRPGARR